LFEWEVRSINILVTCQIHKQKEMEENMKKFDSMLSFVNAKVNVDIDFTANVNLGRQGGGGSNM
jgi:hypothetical protein